MVDMAKQHSNRILSAKGRSTANNITSTQATGAIISHIRLRQGPSGFFLIVRGLSSTIMAGQRDPFRPSPSAAYWRSVPGESRPSLSGEDAFESCSGSVSESGISTARTALNLPVLVDRVTPSALCKTYPGWRSRAGAWRELWTVRMQRMRLDDALRSAIGANCDATTDCRACGADRPGLRTARNRFMYLERASVLLNLLVEHFFGTNIPLVH